MRAILEERGISLAPPDPNDPSKNLKGRIKAKCDTGGERPDGRCCQRHLLMAQHDFREQDGWLAEIVQEMGHEC